MKDSVVGPVVDALQAITGDVALLGLHPGEPNCLLCQAKLDIERVIARLTQEFAGVCVKPR